MNLFENLENIYLNQIEFLKLNNVKSKSENIAISDFDGVATFYVPEKDIISEIHTATLNPDFFYNKQFKINKKEPFDQNVFKKEFGIKLNH